MTKVSVFLTRRPELTVAKDEENFLDRTKTVMFLSSESRIV